MPKRIFFFIFWMTCICVSAHSQPLFWQESRNLSVDAGYKHASLNSGEFDIAYLEATAYFNPQLGWEYSVKFEYGKNYFSFSPMALVGLPFWIYTSTHGGSSFSNLVGAISALSAAKLPIYVWDWFEITPYWNLLKLTKLYDSEKLKINADVGLQLKFYPFYSTWSLTTQYISPFCQYDFAYKKNASEFLYTSWSDKIKRSDKSLFHGYSWGISIGYYF